jgi:sigma54-dependent transcription regulator
LFLLAEARYFPCRLLQTAPPRKQTAGNPGSFSIIDLDLSRYDSSKTAACLNLRQIAYRQLRFLG